MINKEQAQALGVNIRETDEIIEDEQKQLIQKLKNLLPSVINSDGIVDAKALSELLGSNHTGNNQGYELTFAGKSLAKAKASEPTTKELKSEPTQSKNFDDTGNVIIRGDNIDVLKILYQNYYQKIKMIYIDPPYNTKSENFIYKDNFKESEDALIEKFALSEETLDYLQNLYGTRSHSGWLSFMYPRLKLARELLADDGVIFISIDDNEQANLKILCDEIFGEDNFVANITAVMNLKGNHDNFGFSDTLEHLLVYSRNKNHCEIGKFPVSEESIEDEWEVDEYGLFKRADTLKRTGQDAGRNSRPKGWFPVFIDEADAVYVTENDLPKHYAHTTLYPINDKGEELSWTWAKRTITQRSHDLIVINGREGKNIYKKQRPELGDIPTSKPKNIFYRPEYSTSTATNHLKSLLNGKVFSGPKPVPFLKDLLTIGTDLNDITLDFFAGSGTTAHAVMQLNAEDGGNRKFILAQIDEPIDPKNKKSKAAYDFCIENGFEPVISSITIERVNRAGKKIIEEMEKNKDMLKPSHKPDIGYKVFSLTDKPHIKPQDNNQFTLVNQRARSLDTLINMLCATGKNLDVKIEEIIKDKLYKANGEYYLLGQIPKNELDKYKDYKINIDAFANINLESYLNLNLINRENITIIY